MIVVNVVEGEVRRFDYGGGGQALLAVLGK